MKRFNTLRARFALWTALLLLLALAAFGAFVYVGLNRSLRQNVDEVLRLSAEQTASTVQIENGRLTGLDGIDEIATTTEMRNRGVSIRVLDVAGSVVQAAGFYAFSPTQTLDLSALASGPYFHTTHFDKDDIRAYTVPIQQGGSIVGAVQVMQSLGGVQDTLNRLLLAFSLGVPLLVLMAGLGGYFLATRALAPIDHISRTARDISAHDLSARLNLPPTQDEVGRLATTLDDMLARLDGAFRREQQFVADASHELRTPLTAMQAILSVMREEDRSTDDYKQALADLSSEADRMRTLVEDLLRLARSDAGKPLQRQPIYLSELLNDLCESLQPMAAQSHLTLTCQCAPGLTLLGDTDAVLRLFVNLIGNAIKYTCQGGIAVIAVGNAKATKVSVIDTGVGIPENHLPHIFDRFYRADASRHDEGSGLGLAIAMDIARMHGGRIEVNSHVGKGSTFVVTLLRG